MLPRMLRAQPLSSGASGSVAPRSTPAARWRFSSCSRARAPHVHGGVGILSPCAIMSATSALPTSVGRSRDCPPCVRSLASNARRVALGAGGSSFARARRATSSSFCASPSRPLLVARRPRRAAVRQGASAINLSGCSESAAMRRRPSASARRAVSRGSIAASFRNCVAALCQKKSRIWAASSPTWPSRRAVPWQARPCTHGDGHDGSALSARMSVDGRAARHPVLRNCESREGAAGCGRRVGAHAKPPSPPWARARRGRSTQASERCGVGPRPSMSRMWNTPVEVSMPTTSRVSPRLYMRRAGTCAVAGITQGRTRGRTGPATCCRSPCVIRGCIMPPTLGPQHAESLFNRAGLATIATIRNATQAIHEARHAARRHASATGATSAQGQSTDVLYAGATLSTVWDAALCRPWVLDALRAHFTPVASIVELVRAGRFTANHSVLGVHLRDQIGQHWSSSGHALAIASETHRAARRPGAA